MQRFDLINKIGRNYLTSNIENDEFSYPQAFKKKGKIFNKISTYEKLDIRFEDKQNQISILVETKDNFNNWKDEKIIQQLQSYVNYEKTLTGNKIIAILCETKGNKINVFWGGGI